MVPCDLRHDTTVTDNSQVFEDGLAGIKAGLAAGMTVIWVPHPALAKVYGVLGESQRLEYFSCLRVTSALRS